MKPICRLCFFLFGLFPIFLFSCSKDGDTGPQGPAGPPGNAYVKTVSFTNQPFTLNPLANVYQVLVTVSDITPAIVEKGTVTAYVAKANNNNADWTALPGNFNPDLTNISLSRFYNFNYGPGVATIYTSTNPGYNIDLKIVVIAGE